MENIRLKVLAGFKAGKSGPFLGSSVGMETPDNLWSYGLG